MTTNQSETTATTDPVNSPPTAVVSAPDEEPRPQMDLAPAAAVNEASARAEDADVEEGGDRDDEDRDDGIKRASGGRAGHRTRAETSGVRAADGQLEPYDGEEEDGEAAGHGFEPPKKAVTRDEWPVLTFDIALLADPDADHDRREAEWRRVYQHFDPYLRYYFEEVRKFRDADEITAAVWRRALRKIGSLDAPENAWWWLIRVGRNYERDLRKQERRREERDRKGLDRMMEDAGEDWWSVILDEISRETILCDRIDRRRFSHAIATLNDRDHEFVHLLKVEELSHEEVVARLKLTSVEASRQRWRWIKRKLIAALEAP